jgi:hypothetical protein
VRRASDRDARAGGPPSELMVQAPALLERWLLGDASAR